MINKFTVYFRFGNTTSQNGWIYLKARKEFGCKLSQSECFSKTCKLENNLQEDTGLIADCYTTTNDLSSYHKDNDYCGTWEHYPVDAPKGIRCLG